MCNQKSNKMKSKCIILSILLTLNIFAVISQEFSQPRYKLTFKYAYKEKDDVITDVDYDRTITFDTVRKVISFYFNSRRYSLLYTTVDKGSPILKNEGELVFSPDYKGNAPTGKRDFFVTVDSIEEQVIVQINETSQSHYLITFTNQKL